MPRVTVTFLMVLPLVFVVDVVDLHRVDPPVIPQCVPDMLGISSSPFEWKATREGMQCLSTGLLQCTIPLESLIDLNQSGQGAVP